MKKAEEIAIDHGLCRCDEAYTKRGLTAPDCPYHAFAVDEAMEEYSRQFKAQWIPIAEMKNHKISNNTILLFDDGSIRRFAELNHPFAEITHFYNLPELP